MRVRRVVGCRVINATFKEHVTLVVDPCAYFPVVLQVMAEYLWNFMTPWLRQDVQFVTHAEKAFDGSPFLGMHVRRGDKLRSEAKAVEVVVRLVRVCHQMTSRCSSESFLSILQCRTSDKTGMVAMFRYIYRLVSAAHTLTRVCLTSPGILEGSGELLRTRVGCNGGG